MKDINEYRKNYTIGVYYNLTDRLVLISLICFAYKNLKLKNNNLTFLELLL